MTVVSVLILVPVLRHPDAYSIIAIIIEARITEPTMINASAQVGKPDAATHLLAFSLSPRVSPYPQALTH